MTRVKNEKEGHFQKEGQKNVKNVTQILCTIFLKYKVFEDEMIL